MSSASEASTLRNGEYLEELCRSLNRVCPDGYEFIPRKLGYMRCFYSSIKVDGICQRLLCRVVDCNTVVPFARNYDAAKVHVEEHLSDLRVAAMEKRLHGESSLNARLAAFLIRTSSSLGSYSTDEGKELCSRDLGIASPPSKYLMRQGIDSLRKIISALVSQRLRQSNGNLSISVDTWENGGSHFLAVLANGCTRSECFRYLLALKHLPRVEERSAAKLGKALNDVLSKFNLS